MARLHFHVRLLLLVASLACGCGVQTPGPSPITTFALPSATNNTVPIAIQETLVPAISPTIALLEATATKKPKPGYFPLETATSTPTLPYTPTFEPASIKTATPAPAAQCPAIVTSPAPTPSFFFLWKHRDLLTNPEKDLLSYLNNYGLAELETTYEIAVAQKEYWQSFKVQDLTSDGIPEIIIVLSQGQASTLYIVGCQNGEYKFLFQQPDYDGYLSAYSVADIRDGNRNGIPEITFLTSTQSQGGHNFQMYEWNGAQFESLLISDKAEYYGVTFHEMQGLFVEINGKTMSKDIDGDHLDEFVVVTGIPVWSTYLDGLPFRNVTRYHKWDGQHYAFLRQEFTTPEYRFQAVQDGDRFSLSQEFDKALDSYQQAIFSDKLGGWSEEYRLFLQNAWGLQIANKPTPIPPAPDPDEYPNLAAYARYRIMLIHLINGHLPEAQVVYDTLQKLFSEGKPGHPYAEIAQTFWEEYQNSKNTGQACSAAIEYAKGIPDKILNYLGNTDNGETHFGYQSLYYYPDSVCPFQ